MEFRLCPAKKTKNVFVMANYNHKRTKQTQQSAKAAKFQPNTERSKNCSHNDAERNISRSSNNAGKKESKENTKRKVDAEQTCDCNDTA